MSVVDIAPPDQPAVEAAWAAYVASSGYDGPLVSTFAFGDSAEMADELGSLVRDGTKKATAGPLQAFEAEGDRTRSWWLDAHLGFFTRQCRAMGLAFSEDVDVVFERFELVWPSAAGDAGAGGRGLELR